MTTQLIAAALLTLSLAAPALAGESNNEPFPLNASISSVPGSTLQISMLPLTNGLPAGALNGTPAYEQAQSVSRWYAQQADHRFAQQKAVAAQPNG